MRRFIILVLMSSLAVAAPRMVWAQDAAAPAGEMEETPPPDIAEYNQVPDGLLIAPDADTKKKDDAGDVPASQVLGQIPGVYEIPGMPQSDDGQSVLTMDQILNAYKKGDYPTVLRNAAPMAENHQHTAEELLGIMYMNGQGIAKDPVKALDLLGRAAEASLPLAEHYLGVMYFSGQGMETPDVIKGLMWLEISILHYQDGPGKDRALQDRDAVYTKTTRLERSRANELAREWLGRHGEEHLMDMRR